MEKNFGVLGDRVVGKDKGRTYPGIIEDNAKYEGKSYFCNIDAFSKQGCQKFPKVTGRIRHKV